MLPAQDDRIDGTEYIFHHRILWDRSKPRWSSRPAPSTRSLAGLFMSCPALAADGLNVKDANVSNTVADLRPGYVSGSYGYRGEVRRQTSRLVFLVGPYIAGAAVRSATLLVTPGRPFESSWAGFSVWECRDVLERSSPRLGRDLPLGAAGILAARFESEFRLTSTRLSSSPSGALEDARERNNRGLPETCLPTTEYPGLQARPSAEGPDRQPHHDSQASAVFDEHSTLGTSTSLPGPPWNAFGWNRQRV